MGEQLTQEPPYRKKLPLPPAPRREAEMGLLPVSSIS